MKTEARGGRTGDLWQGRNGTTNANQKSKVDKKSSNNFHKRGSTKDLTRGFAVFRKTAESTRQCRNTASIENGDGGRGKVKRVTAA